MSTIERLIEVKAPVERVFSLFRDPMNLPEWVQGGGVHVIDERRFRWLIKRTNGSWSWEVSVQAFEPLAHLLWRAAPTVRDRQGENGFTLETFFEETKRNTTILRLIYSEAGLPNEVLATNAAPAKGPPANGSPPAMTARELELGLEHFKRFAERYDAEQEEGETAITSAAPGITRPPVENTPPVAPSMMGLPTANTRPLELVELESLRQSSPSEAQVGWRKLPYSPVLLGLAVLIALASGALIWLAREQQQKQARAAAEAPPAPTIDARSETGTSPSEHIDEPTRSNKAKVQQQDASLEARTEIGRAGNDENQALREALSGWVAATNARDTDALMNFYASKLERYYLRKNFTRDEVRTDKRRLDKLASLEAVRVGPPELTVSSDGRSAQMSFRKEYGVENSKIKRRGEVVQELRWIKLVDGWKITSERDLRVIR